jgi:hypothetical protein
MDKSVNKANEKLNFLSDDEEICRLVELSEKGKTDEIARIELAIEKSKLAMAIKMFNKRYESSEVSELLGLPEQTIQRWCESEIESISVIQSISAEGLESG